MSWQEAIGEIVSTTVTVEVHVEALPFTSVTVNVTVLAPIIEQSKAVMSAA